MLFSKKKNKNIKSMNSRQMPTVHTLLRRLPMTTKHKRLGMGCSNMKGNGHDKNNIKSRLEVSPGTSITHIKMCYLDLRK